MKYVLTVETDSAEAIADMVKSGLRAEKKIEKAAQVGDNRAAKANAKPSTPPPPKPEPEPEPEPEPTKNVTKADIKQLMQDLCEQFGSEVPVLALLHAHGWKKCSDIPNKAIDEFYAELEGIKK